MLESPVNFSTVARIKSTYSNSLRTYYRICFVKASKYHEQIDKELYGGHVKSVSNTILGP